MIEQNSLFQKAFQEMLLAHLLRCQTLSPLIHESKITQEDFDLNIHRAILIAAKECLKAMGGGEVSVALETLIIQLNVMLDCKIIARDERDALCECLDRMYSCEPSPQYYRGLLPQFLSEQRLRRAIKSAKQGDDPRALVDRFNREMERCNFEERPVNQNPLEDFVFTEGQISVPTGFDGIDNGLGGGLGKKELGIICGITGLGKTTLGINFAWGAAKQGFKARFLTLELPYEKICARIYSLIAEYDYRKILKGDPDRSKAEINEEVQQLVRAKAGGTTKNLRVWDFSQEECTPTKIETHIKREQDAGNAPDVLIVDWLDVMGLSPSAARTEYAKKEFRHKLRSNSDDLSRIAREHDVAIWATTQANIQADNKAEVRMNNSSESFSKLFACSVFLGVGATDRERQRFEDKPGHSIYTVTAGKNRDAPPFTAKLYADLTIQKLSDYGKLTEQKDLTNFPIEEEGKTKRGNLKKANVLALNPSPRRT